MTVPAPIEIEEFRRDGVTVLRQLLSDDWIEALAGGVEHNRTHPSAWAHWYTNPDESVGFWSDYVTWRDVPAYQRIVFESGLARTAAELMGTRTARFFHEHVLVKEPGATERTPWHHDQPYYSVDGDQNVSMWIALDPVPDDRAMRFIAGSHRWNRWFIPRRFVDHVPYAPESDRYELLPDIDRLIADRPDEHRVRSFDTEPGDVIVFHFRTLHDAPGNPSASMRRRAVSLRWLGDDAVWAERPWQVSPPYESGGLAPGDALDDARFPVVARWPPGGTVGGMSKPPLPDGLVAVVKRDCETCQTVVPVLQQLTAAGGITVYTQDDPDFPGEPAAIHDADLAVSWHHDIETVPTLIKVVDGAETDRTFGWSQQAWREFTGIDDLGEGLPPMRPGCGSKSVDPDLVDELRVRHGGSVLASRRIEIADAEDDIEMMFTRGWSDGLPVVPPTEERVLRMLTGTSRAPDEIVATIPPDLVPATVEKIAIAAVMAGCLPEHLPWVLTAVEAVCNDEFNMHGLLATTMPVGPVVVCSGPGTRAIGMNSGINALGQGNRANSTIGRALQLVVRNIGGGRPGEVDRATHGNPGKLGFCFAENDVDSPYGTLAEQRGLDAGVDAVTVFAGEGPRGIVDQLSRSPESLANTLAHQLQAVHHHKLVLGFDAILVMGPEHARVFADAGWDRDRILFELHIRLTTPFEQLVRGAADISEGVPEALAAGNDDPPALPKFRPDGLMLAHVGGGAGLFSVIIPGWVNGEMGSKPVTRQVRY